MLKVIPLATFDPADDQSTRPPIVNPRVLLVGPFDPDCGEYTFLAPPLGVWRLAGVLEAAGVTSVVFDPNCCVGSTARAFENCLRHDRWDLIGFSTTGMTLRFDLALVHLARRLCPQALIIAGGMEATFDPETVFRLGGVDLIALGEGEEPLLEIVDRLRRGAPLDRIAGSARLDAAGRVHRIPQRALDRTSFRDATYRTPYEKMPYREYWTKLERVYKVGDLPEKAHREARLAEIRSVRLNTLNYCPMGCTFCSSTNFLNEAQGGTARIARLDPDECLAMIRRIVLALPDVETIIFQDDIFVFTADHRIGPLCEGIVAAKQAGDLPPGLQFISTNRIDAMNPSRLEMMKRAGFRVLGFGVESFSAAMLKEFNKAQIVPFIRPNLQAALSLGITPFLDLILTSPGCTLSDVTQNVSGAFEWLLAGCEAGMYPYVIPFSGAAMARDDTLRPYTITTRHRIEGTDIEWDQPSKILPADRDVAEVVLTIEERFAAQLKMLEHVAGHLPSRVRSLLWISSAIPVLSERGQPVPSIEDATRELRRRLPRCGSRTEHALAHALARPAVKRRRPLPADSAADLTVV